MYPCYPASLDPFEWLENDGGRRAKGREGEREGERVTVNWTDDTGKSWEAGERESSVALSEIREKMGEMPRVRKARKPPRIPLDRMKMARIRWKDEVVDQLALKSSRGGRNR